MSISVHRPRPDGSPDRPWRTPRRAALGLLLLLAGLAGCASRPATAAPAGNGPRIVFVPGVAGDGPWYDNLRRGLVDAGLPDRPESFAWGAPGPLFAMNFNTKSIHHAAERKLAERLGALSSANADLTLLGHSAGCGVILGALARLPESVRVRDVVLLHPSVSPGYDLTPALARVAGRITVFHSDRDTTFLKWRTGTFGTYDGVKTSAAGHGGFDLAAPPEAERTRVTQVAYDPSFAELDNDGGHFGATARAFVRTHVAPAIAAPAVAE
jgi:pimeloyl-ACP methyl ester carboxylesterase